MINRKDIPPSSKYVSEVKGNCNSNTCCYADDIGGKGICHLKDLCFALAKGKHYVYHNPIETLLKELEK
jgi:hypothetical protein